MLCPFHYGVYFPPFLANVGYCLFLFESEFGWKSFLPFAK